MSCVEPCWTWRMRGNYETKKLELRLEWGKCKHLYFYWEHEELGFMHLRLQTWFPFSIHVCVNGREWLGRQMDKAGIAYRQEDNCFPWIGDVGRAQELMEEQHRTDWPRVLEELVKRCHPVHEEISRPIELGYYWTASQSEYASDVMFRDRGALERIYPPLVHHAVMPMGAEQVMRYMGRSGRVGIHSALGQEAAGVCRAVGSKKGRHRALNPMGDADSELMAAVSRGEYLINGFRNRDVRVHLYGVANDKQQERKEMAAVGRKLRLLRAHGLIAKVSKTQRYMVTKKGRRIMTALLAARQASTEKLSAMAA